MSEQKGTNEMKQDLAAMAGRVTWKNPCGNLWRGEILGAWLLTVWGDNAGANWTAGLGAHCPDSGIVGCSPTLGEAQAAAESALFGPALDALRARVAGLEAEVERLTTLRPMSESPRDGQPVLLFLGYDPVVGKWRDYAFCGNGGWEVEGFCDHLPVPHFSGWLPIPAPEARPE